MLGRTRLRPGGGLMTDWLLDQVQIDKDMQVLEVACNRGDNLIRVYTKYKCKIIGIDNFCCSCRSNKGGILWKKLF